MIDLINFEQYEQNDRMYGGAAGRKLGVIIDNENYIVKFPGNLKDKNLSTVKLSYSNSPVCEYIGSHVYESIGLPVHETKLGEYRGKIVVGCKDFLADTDKLIEFEKIKVTFMPAFVDSNGEETNGTGTDLQEVIMTIREHPLLQKIEGVEDRFWDMFVGDALIGNPDRNNGNWGIIKRADGAICLAPIYDNGNCLNNKWDEDKMKGAIADSQTLDNESYRRKTCVFLQKEHHIKPYEFIFSKKNKMCNEAVKRLVPKMNMKEINHIICEIPCISDVQKAFYSKMIENRYQKIMLPTLHELERTFHPGIYIPER